MREEWTYKEIVEPQSGKIHRLYWYKGKICKRIILDTHLAKQLAGYVLIEKDLRSALTWLKEIDKIRGSDLDLDKLGSRASKDRNRYDLVKGLFVAALTFYGKAFAQAEGRRVKLERNQIAVELQSTHDEAISFRNNFAAHSGAKLIERAVITLVLPPKPKPTNLPRIYREMSQPDFAINQVNGKTFIELIEHVRKIPLDKIESISEKILVEEVLPHGYSHWATK